MSAIERFQLQYVGVVAGEGHVFLDTSKPNAWEDTGLHDPMTRRAFLHMMAGKIAHSGGWEVVSNSANKLAYRGHNLALCGDETLMTFIREQLIWMTQHKLQ